MMKIKKKKKKKKTKQLHAASRARSTLEAGSRKAIEGLNWRFEASCSQFRKQHLAVWAAGRGPFTSCGVLALRDGPVTGAGQDKSQLQEDASKLEAGSAGRQANWRFEASV